MLSLSFLMKMKKQELAELANYLYLIRMGQFPINSTGRWYLVTFRRLKSEGSDGLLPGWRPEWRKDSGKWGGAPFRNQAVLLGAPIGFHYFFDLVFDRLKITDELK